MGTDNLSVNGSQIDRLELELANKIQLITTFITEDASAAIDTCPSRLHTVRDRVTTILDSYAKTSWNIVDQTNHPNTESKAPDGIWGTVSAETPNIPSSSELRVTPTLNYSMVLTLHKVGSTQIEVPLLDGEKAPILEAIASLREVNSSTIHHGDR